ncbi:HAD family hydrolase [Lactococcus protaetiae]|uniref:HAD family phosphatase n=1 Tax=Lactococcus protaetiae TaxID=2592653 RepID=A0A514Z8I0_9LACT|nr:HAD family phosphatase [Lactococcus protaetiae]QDK70873.1 HAD family phosphatase [Lactococcus protaetiae]
MKFKAVIFDMDGVLVDTERYYLQRRADFFGSHHISIDHLTPSDFIGGNMKDIWPRILRDSYNENEAKQLQVEYDLYKKNTPMPYKELLFPDVTRILSYLQAQQVKIALASSSTMLDIDLALDTHHLRPYFDVILSGNDFKESKPNPEIYLSAMTKLEVNADESLIIEDSEKGIQAGKAAGATVWAVKDYRFGMNQARADRFVDTLTEAQKLLTSL